MFAAALEVNFHCLQAARAEGPGHTRGVHWQEVCILCTVYILWTVMSGVAIGASRHAATCDTAVIRKYKAVEHNTAVGYILIKGM